MALLRGRQINDATVKVGDIYMIMEQQRAFH